MNETTIRLGDHFLIRKGKKIEETERSQNSVRYIQIDDLRNDSDIKYCDGSCKYVFAKPSDVIIAWDGANAGTIGYGLSGAIGSTLALLTTNNDNILPEYAGVFLQTKFSEIRDHCTGATIPHVSRAYLESINIPVPNKCYQKKIVNSSKILLGLIEKRIEQIAVLENLTLDTFADMFGDPKMNPFEWEKKKMDEICKKITDGTHQSPRFVPEGIPFLFVSNIRDGLIDYTTQKFISEEEYAALIKRTPIELGDILYTIVGSYGNPAVVRSLDKFCFQRHIAYLKPDATQIDSDYLASAMLTSDFKEQLEFRVKGIAQKTLNLSELKQMIVCVPPLELQYQYKAIVEKINLQKTRLKASLVELETTYKSTLQKAFYGELFQ